MLPILVRNFLVKHPELIYCVDGSFVLTNEQIKMGSIDIIEYAKHEAKDQISSEIAHNGGIIIRTLNNGSETFVAGRAYYVNMEEYIRNYITEKIENMAKQIELTKDTMCAHDQHEIKNYPRPWYKPKPELPKGTVLKVKETWSNFYGTYHRCVTPDGEYDIPVENAIEITPKVGELEETCASEVCRYRGNGVCTFRKGEYCPLYEPNAEEIARVRMERKGGKK